jgi:hypothetical protein
MGKVSDQGAGCKVEEIARESQSYLTVVCW